MIGSVPFHGGAPEVFDLTGEVLHLLADLDEIAV
jgi:hypothetical protein